LSLTYRRSRAATVATALLVTVMVAGACSSSATTAPTAAPTGAPGTAAASQGASGPVRVAVFGPMTGIYAATGKQIWNGAKLCADDINKAGGVLGQTLEVVQTDDQGDPGAGTLAAQKVADDPTIVGTLGWLNSSVAIPSSKIFNPLNLTQISVGATNPVLTAQGFKNVFRVVADDDYQAPAQYLFLKKKFQPKSIALIDESTESTVLMGDRIEKLTGPDGVKTTRFSIRPQDKDFRAVLGTIPKDVDAMIANITGAQALWAVQAKELGFDVPIMSNDGSIDPIQYIQAAAGAAEGAFATSGAADASLVPAAAKFVTDYKAAYNEEPAGYAPVACVAVQVIADAINRAGKADRAAITAAMASAKVDTILGPMSFDEFGNPANPQMYIYQVVGDGFKMVDNITVSVPVK
jgi:branched-chain amino acid transport system substrate-binding protein